jgi:AraC-like DNA-binding protein
MPLARAFGDAGAALERRLAGGFGDPDVHIACVEEFLASLRPDGDERYERLRAVVADMLVVDRAAGVAELARRHAMSERTLQRLFRDYVGVSPKWVLKRYRVHEAAERIAAGEADDAVRLALDLGYFDQSHFIRDFTAQVGRPPGVYARMCAMARGDEPPVERAA